MSDFGQDVSTFPGLDPNFGPITGVRVVAEAIARRLSTPTGGLPFYPNDGIDLREWLNESWTASATAAIQRAIEAECLKDERVDAAAVAVSFNASASALTVSITLQTAAGPFRLVLQVTAVTVSILSVS